MHATSGRERRHGHRWRDSEAQGPRTVETLRHDEASRKNIPANLLEASYSSERLGQMVLRRRARGPDSIEHGREHREVT